MTEFITTALGSLVSIGGVVYAAIKGFKFVQEGQRGAMLRFGKFTRLVEPGFVIMIPWINELKRVHVKQSTINLDKQTITTKDKLSFVVSAVILHRVNDVYKVLFEVNGATSATSDLAMSVVREVISSKKYDNVVNLEAVNQELMERLKPATDQWGVELLSFRITDFVPTPETSQVLVQVEAARAQAAGNKILLDDILMHQAKKIKTIKTAVPAPALAALLLRGSGGVPVVDAGAKDTGVK